MDYQLAVWVSLVRLLHLVNSPRDSFARDECPSVFAPNMENLEGAGGLLVLSALALITGF